VNHKYNRLYQLRILVVFVLMMGMAGCDSKDEKGAMTANPVMAPAPMVSGNPATEAQTAPSATEPASSKESVPSPSKGTTGESNNVVEVDGVKLSKVQLNTDMNKKLAELKGQIPAESLTQAKSEIRKGLIDEFVVRTLLGNEMDKKKITASDKEISEILDGMKAQLPPGVTMEDLLKKNKIDTVKMREEIALNVRINKLVSQETGGKVKITDKETTDFYNKNIDQFKQPESVHARHLLVAFAAGDTDKMKAEKKAKAEELRKKLLGGADFAQLAATNSDCPSKEKGGDLGTFTRGQMVKPFENAAFTQEKNAIGPVVETDFGFHIIQVIDHTSEKVTKLDAELKKRIVAYLENQKQQEAFGALVKKLKASANIVVYGK
jgi:peptidyl-prolyl cis-trans isomerase C